MDKERSPSRDGFNKAFFLHTGLLWGMIWWFFFPMDRLLSWTLPSLLRYLKGAIYKGMGFRTLVSSVYKMITEVLSLSFSSLILWEKIVRLLLAVCESWKMIWHWRGMNRVRYLLAWVLIGFMHFVILCEVSRLLLRQLCWEHIPAW